MSEASGEGATLSGLSLVTIAARAGASRNTLYRRWRTKDALYLDVLASISPPLPERAGRGVEEEVHDLLAVLVKRTFDRRVTRMVRAMIAESDRFPDLYRRYFTEVTTPARRAMHAALGRGVVSSEIRRASTSCARPSFLVAPILNRISSAQVDDLDPEATGRRITSIVFLGLRPRGTP